MQVHEHKSFVCYTIICHSGKWHNTYNTLPHTHKIGLNGKSIFICGCSCAPPNTPHSTQFYVTRFIIIFFILGSFLAPYCQPDVAGHAPIRASPPEMFEHCVFQRRFFGAVSQMERKNVRLRFVWAVILLLPSCHTEHEVFMRCQFQLSIYIGFYLIFFS